LRKGLSSLAFIIFLVSFIAMVSFFSAQYLAAPKPTLNAMVLKFNASTNSSYFAATEASNYTLIHNVPAVNVTAITCGGGLILVDGIIGCVWNYGSAFLAFVGTSSDNAFLAIFLSILTLGTIWAIATLWGGS
jgi:hypothetical protein